MAVEDLFHAELHGTPDPMDDPYRARRISGAAATALDAAGASISVQVSQVRVPLGASSETAALAESIQFSEGTGPCIEAIASNSRVDAPAAELKRRWPALAHRWRTETPYRSALSEPVGIDGVTGALDIYLTHADGGARFDAADMDTVSELVTRQLRSDLYASADTPDMVRRSNVWVAIGMLRERYGLNSNAALQRVRNQAKDAGITVDEFAVQLLRGLRSLE